MVMRYRIVYPDELNHYGVKGMRWGVRKDYRANSIGSTAIKNFKSNVRLLTDPNRKNNTIPLKEQKIFGGKGRTVGQLKAEANYKDSKKPQLNDAQKSQIRRERAKKAAIIGGTLAVAGLAAYGGYKLRSSAVQSLSNKYKKYATDSLRNASQFRKSASDYGQLADVNRLRAMKAGSRGDFDSHRMFMNNFRSNYEMSRKRDKMAEDAYELASKLSSQAANKKFDKGELSKEMVNIARNKLKKRK